MYYFTFTASSLVWSAAVKQKLGNGLAICGRCCNVLVLEFRFRPWCNLPLKQKQSIRSTCNLRKSCCYLTELFTVPDSKGKNRRELSCCNSLSEWLYVMCGRDLFVLLFSFGSSKDVYILLLLRHLLSLIRLTLDCFSKCLPSGKNKNCSRFIFWILFLYYKKNYTYFMKRSSNS